MKQCTHCGTIYNQNQAQCPRCLSTSSIMIYYATKNKQLTPLEDYERDRAYAEKKQTYADMEEK